jgi:hypothetical protein
MPYVSQEKRVELDHPDFEGEVSPGELNYLISELINQYLGKDYNYSDINEAIGVLECAKLELYQRVATPYENIKREQNGGVYEVDK